MPKKIVAVSGTYRKGHIVDSLVDEVLDAARAAGASTVKIQLLDRNIEFCANCRACSQEPGRTRGICVKKDDMAAILDEIDSADALVLASPVNIYNVTALFKRFMERLTPYCFWPWQGNAPKSRIKTRDKKALLIASSAMPGFMIPLFTGTHRALAGTAKGFGAQPVASLWVGLAAKSPDQAVPARTLGKARKIGARLAA